MYKKFLELFGKENLLDQAIELTIKMLEDDYDFVFVKLTDNFSKRALVFQQK